MSRCSTFPLARTRPLISAVVIAACTGTGGVSCGAGRVQSNDDAGGLPDCSATLGDYCAEAGALCPASWSAAGSLVYVPECAGGVYLYACDGFDVASCPGDEGGGRTLIFDTSSHALVAVAVCPSIMAGGQAGCYFGPAPLRASIEPGPPACPTGPLLGTPNSGALDAGAGG
jgi:hypothetical protein